MTDVSQILDMFLAGRGLVKTPGPLLAAFEVAIRGENGSWLLVAVPVDRTLMLLSELPVLVPDDRRQRVADVFTRLNFGLVDGTFELDLAEGDARFRTSVAFPEDVDDERAIELLATSFDFNLQMMDGNLATMLAAIYGENSVDELCEEEEDSDSE